ncbi:chaperone DnaJ-domain superfamily protein, partial [Tanacetum coccineum]
DFLPKPSPITNLQGYYLDAVKISIEAWRFMSMIHWERLSSEAFPNNKPSRLLPGCSENFHRGTEVHVDDPLGESRRIACQRCGGFHMWFFTNKAKSKARSCQVPPFRKLLRYDPCSTVI